MAKIKINKTKIKISESSLHQQVVDYLKWQHPDVLWRTDFAAGIKMNIGQAVKHKRLQKCRAWPDIFIAKKSNGYGGLFIEIKKNYDEVYLKDGITLRKDDHVHEQDKILNLLRQENYQASFGCGFQHIKFLIDSYLKQH
jgi:hypothetical protein